MRYAGAGSPLVEFEGDLDCIAMWAGTSVDAIHEIKPAAMIVRDLVREAEAALG